MLGIYIPRVPCCDHLIQHSQVNFLLGVVHFEEHNLPAAVTWLQQSALAAKSVGNKRLLSCLCASCACLSWTKGSPSCGLCDILYSESWPSMPSHDLRSVFVLDAGCWVGHPNSRPSASNCLRCSAELGGGALYVQLGVVRTCLLRYQLSKQRLRHSRSLR